MAKLLLVLACGFANRVRGGASAWLGEATPIPRDVWRYSSFVGFGFLLATLAGLPPVEAAAFGAGMWQLGARLGGWSGLFAGRLGLDVEPEDWMIGPLRDRVLASIARGFAWGLGGVVAAWPVAVVLGHDVRQAFAVPVALAIAFVVAPVVARQASPGWYVDNAFIGSRWGWLELFVGLIAGALCALS